MIAYRYVGMKECILVGVHAKKTVCLRAHPHLLMFIRIYEWCIREKMGVPAGTPSLWYVVVRCGTL